MKYYLVGIKGTGMSALSCLLKDLGEEVIGSDVDECYFTQQALIDKNITFLKFNEKNIDGRYIYIISNAFNEKNNVEVKMIIEKGYRFFYYQDFIEYYFKNIKIGISGTHGKTTTTSIICKLLEDKKISYLIGDSSGKGTKDYDYFVFEACEYKNHFHKYTFDYLIINNIDYDHPDFFKNIDAVEESFNEAAKKAKVVIVNNDDERLQKLEHHNKITFGKSYNSDVIISNVIEYQNGYEIELTTKECTTKYFIPCCGAHNIYNFVASYTLLYALHLLDINIQEKMNHYVFPNRRMKEYAFKNNIIIDDYAHHPTEIRGLIEAVKQKYKDYKIIVVFQPHTYSRTFKLKKEFKKVFDNVDELYLAPTFTSKRERKNIIKELWIRSIFYKARRYTNKSIKYLSKQSNTIIIYLGAGTINKDIDKIIMKKL